jgi:hypothetical protein
MRRDRTACPLPLGENRYSFFSNNCEHLSEWCVNGDHRSPQVERLRARLACVSRVFGEITRLLPRRADGLQRSGA